MVNNTLYIPGIYFLIVSGLLACKEENIIPEITPEFCRNQPVNSYLSCVVKPDTTTLDIATWNIKLFPENGATTVEAVQEIIDNFNADIIAVQEVHDPAEFYKLATALPDWEAQVYNSDFLSLGFIYNTCEILSVSDIKVLNIGDTYPFPRLPVEMKAMHLNGLEVILINVHLKCCTTNNGYDRRVAASEILKNYIDTTYPEENVILLGDMNDEIETSGSPFSNFISDETNYLFTDMAIATGGSKHFSYPSWPSHLDHILVTNELFDNISTTQTVKLENCVNSYSTVVSDHRPVILTLLEEN